jgi:hypothetical protein
MYKLTMYFNTEKDDWENGLTGESGAYWMIDEVFSTLEQVKECIKDNTYSGYGYIEQDEDVEGTYRTAYITTDDNMGEMDEQELENWKAGKINGWTVDISFTVGRVEYTAVPDINFKEVILK